MHISQRKLIPDSLGKGENNEELRYGLNSYNRNVFNVCCIRFLCERARETKKPPPSPPTLENATLLNLVPLAEGGLYAINEVEGIIWYVNQNKAVRINGFPAGFVLGISPTADGGAYVQVQRGNPSDGLWYLKADTAIKVQEVPSVANDKMTLNSRERWLWAMWQHEWLRRQKEEDKERE